MSRKTFVDHNCFLCKGYVEDYTIEGDSEWLLTKRGLKQYFHTSCYAKMVERNRAERAAQKI